MNEILKVLEVQEMFKGKPAFEHLEHVDWPLAGQTFDNVKFIKMDVYEMMTVQKLGKLMGENELLHFIGLIAGECYNSSKDYVSCVDRALNCIKRGHTSPWEHYNISLNCLVDRGTSHALVRHRHTSFQQSSTIYQAFKEGIVVVDRPNYDPCTGKAYKQYTRHDVTAFQNAHKHYTRVLLEGLAPSDARDTLPNALATNLILTTNIVQWMFMIHRRVGPGDSVRMHVWAMQVREWFERTYPAITEAFDKYYEEHPL